MHIRKKFLLAIFLSAVVLPTLWSCAASRKLQAASVLKKCELEITGARLDSVNLNLDRFMNPESAPKHSPIPNARLILLVQNVAQGKIPDSLGVLHFAISTGIRNASEDTLWLRSVKMQVHFDSLSVLPIDYNDSALAISPGRSEAFFPTHLLIGPQIWKILSPDTIRVTGDLEFSLSKDGEPVPFHVDRKRAILPEERTAFLDRAKEQVLSTIIDSWTNDLR